MVTQKLAPNRTPDKNARRIEKQLKIQAQVQNGLPVASQQKTDPGSMHLNPLATTQIGHFAVDPELERAMAAQTLGLLPNELKAQSATDPRLKKQTPQQKMMKKDNLKNLKGNPSAVSQSTPKSEARTNPSSGTATKTEAKAKTHTETQVNAGKKSKAKLPKRKTKSNENLAIEETDVWKDKGDPTFASPEENLPGPL